MIRTGLARRGKPGKKGGRAHGSLTLIPMIDMLMGEGAVKIARKVAELESLIIELRRSMTELKEKENELKQLRAIRASFLW